MSTDASDLDTGIDADLDATPGDADLDATPGDADPDSNPGDAGPDGASCGSGPSPCPAQSITLDMGEEVVIMATLNGEADHMSGCMPDGTPDYSVSVTSTAHGRLVTRIPRPFFGAAYSARNGTCADVHSTCGVNAFPVSHSVEVFANAPRILTIEGFGGCAAFEMTLRMEPL